MTIQQDSPSLNRYQRYNSHTSILYGNHMKLLVRNLARTTTEEELRTMFEAHGIVQSCNLVIDKNSGGSKGFGFIEMPKPADAKAAMKTLNGKDVAGKNIRIKKAESTQGKNKSSETGSDE